MSHLSSLLAGLGTQAKSSDAGPVLRLADIESHGAAGDGSDFMRVWAEFSAAKAAPDPVNTPSVLPANDPHPQGEVEDQATAATYGTDETPSDAALAATGSKTDGDQIDRPGQPAKVGSTAEAQATVPVDDTSAPLISQSSAPESSILTGAASENIIRPGESMPSKENAAAIPGRLDGSGNSSNDRTSAQPALTGAQAPAALPAQIVNGAGASTADRTPPAIPAQHIPATLSGKKLTNVAPDPDLAASSPISDARRGSYASSSGLLQGQSVLVPIKAQGIGLLADPKSTGEATPANTAIAQSAGQTPPQAEVAADDRPTTGHGPMIHPKAQTDAHPLFATAPPSTSLLSFDPNLMPDDPALTEVRGPQTTTPQTAQASAAAATPRYVAQQIATGIVHSSGATTHIALNPEELGTVRISLTNGENGLLVAILADRPETADLMRRHIEHLTRELRDIGYENPSFTFDHQSSSGEQAPQDAPDHATAAPETLLTDIPVQAARRVTVSTGLDLKL